MNNKEEPNFSKTELESKVELESKILQWYKETRDIDFARFFGINVNKQ